MAGCPESFITLPLQIAWGGAKDKGSERARGDANENYQSWRPKFQGEVREGDGGGGEGESQISNRHKRK